MDLGEHKDLSRQLLASAAVATILVDVAGVLHYANPAFARLSGFSPADLEGASLRFFFDDPALLWTAAGRDEGSEHQLRRKGEGRLWVRALTAPFPGAGAGRQALIVQLVDIDRQKQVEAARLVNEQRLTFALEAAGQGVWDLDIATRSGFFSAAWRQMRGIPLDEAIEISMEAWIERIHPDDRDAARRAATPPEPWSTGFGVLDYRERHRQGHYIWVHARGRNVAWDADGRPTRIVGTDTDITDLKLAQKEFQLLSRRLEMALDASRIGVWEQDLDTGEVIWDRRLDEIYQRAPNDQLAGPFWEASVHPDDRDAALSDFSQAIEARKDYGSEFRIVRPDGEVRYLHSRARVFENVDGSRKVIGTEWDVTAEVELKQELQRAKALAESRYAALIEAQELLRHAALYDELTDLPNRRYFNEVLTERRLQAQARQAGLALLHIDLDRFKQINDSLGHAAGDAMLRHAADVLRANIRQDDFVARIGGDEFVVLSWFDGEPGELQVMAERIIGELRLGIDYEGHRMQVGASIGIACAATLDAIARPLMREADLALYRAKQLGRNRYEFAA